MSVNVKFRKTKKELSSFSVIILSSVLSFIIFFVMLSVFSLFIMKNHTEKSLLQIFVIIASGVSTLFSGFFSSYSVKSKRLIFGMLNAIFIAISEFVILLCFNNASLSWQVYFMIPVAILTSFAGCVLGINLKK